MRFVNMMALVGVVLLISACDMNKEEEKMTSLTFSLGQPGQEFIRKNSLAEKAHVTQQPAGLNFYKYEWPRNNLGRVTIQNKKDIYSIPYVLSVLGTEDSDSPASGVFKVVVNACISESETIMHDEARLKIAGLLKDLDSGQWQVAHAYDDPRLSGESAFEYYLQDDSYGLPIDYVPTLEQWMEMDLAYWNLFKDDTFLQLTFRRDRKKLDPSKEGAYLLTFSFRTSNQKLQEMFEPAERDSWEDLLPKKIVSLKKERERKEKLLSQRGISIDTDYLDPEVSMREK
ncbi:hypothetical protein TDB9533_00183 [Thalassocella blandensis]|nr:hypothetical protein TDB9533_00183 [Thalassocella blandensis]